MNDRLIPILFLFASGVAFVVLGVLCVARPDKVADYCRRRHLRNSPFMQKWPFARMVMDPWIPTYLRFMGVFVLVFAVMLFFLGFFALSK